LVRIVKTTICGIDLHILKGNLPSCAPERILGHERVGIVEKIGGRVTAFHPGDHAAGAACVLIARPVAGSWGTRSMAPF